METNCVPLVADLFLLCYERKYDTVSTKLCDKRDDFNFDIVNFPFLAGDVPRRPSYYGVYIYLNLFALPELLRILLTSIIVTNS